MEDCTIKLIKTSASFATNYWDRFVPYLESLVEQEEGRKPTIQHMNNILLGLNSGHLDLWIGVRFNEQEREMLGFLITSKYLGGPSGAGVLWISYLCGMAALPEEAWAAGIEELKQWAALNNCTQLIATTRYAHVAKACMKTGAAQDMRLTWRV